MTPGHIRFVWTFTRDGSVVPLVEENKKVLRDINEVDNGEVNKDEEDNMKKVEKFMF